MPSTEKLKEREIERLIRDYLEAQGYLVVKTDAGHAARFTKRTMGHAVWGDVPSGFPDLIVLHPEQPAWFIEVKAPGGRLSQAQKLMHQYLREQGYKVVVAYGLGDVVS